MQLNIEFKKPWRLTVNDRLTHWRTYHLCLNSKLHLRRHDDNLVPRLPTTTSARVLYNQHTLDATQQTSSACRHNHRQRLIARVEYFNLTLPVARASSIDESARVNLHIVAKPHSSMCGRYGSVYVCGYRYFVSY